jgi:anti-anti-sigma factor
MSDFSLSNATLAGNAVVSRLTGNMELGDLNRLDDDFDKLLQAGVDGLIIDASELDGLTSAGLGAIVNMARIMRERKGKLIFAAAKPDILGLIEMFGLQDRLNLCESLDKAKMELASGRG